MDCSSAPFATSFSFFAFFHFALIVIVMFVHTLPRVGRRKAGQTKRRLFQFALGYFSTLQKLRRFQQAARKENQSQ